MEKGLLWFDSDQKKDLLRKIRQASGRYRIKFGMEPNTCYVNNNALDEEKVLGGVRVKPSSTVLPHHLWLGWERGDA